MRARCPGQSRGLPKGYYASVYKLRGSGAVRRLYKMARLNLDVCIQRGCSYHRDGDEGRSLRSLLGLH